MSEQPDFGFYVVCATEDGKTFLDARGRYVHSSYLAARFTEERARELAANDQSRVTVATHGPDSPHIYYRAEKAKTPPTSAPVEFPTGFKDKARAGDEIKVTIDGIEFAARIVKDDDRTPPPERDEGFWPSLDPRAPGYVGENPETPFDVQMANCNEVMRRHKAGSMVYCGVVLSARKGHAQLLGIYESALWGVDINWPHGDNSYLREVANELLAESFGLVKTRLQAKIHGMESSLADLRR